MGCWREPTARNAWALSIVSVFCTFIAAFIGIGFYVTAGSALCLVFGLENVVDFLSSVVVLWRFFTPRKITPEREELLRKRELRSSTLISFILILLGIGVISSASYDLVNGAENDYDLQLVIGIAFSSILIFGALCVFKFQYANKLESSSLFKDGVCSLIGTVLAAALFVNTLIIRANPDVWWLDPLVAMLAGIVALFYGMYSVILLCRKRVPICQLSWWLMSRGDGKANAAHSTESDLEMSENEKEDEGGATTLSNEVV